MFCAFTWLFFTMVGPNVTPYLSIRPFDVLKIIFGMLLFLLTIEFKT